MSEVLVEECIEFFGCAGDFIETETETMAAVREVLASGQVLSGPDVSQFERRLAEMAERKHAVAVGSATDALFFALHTAGIASGNEVLVPDITFIASASAILRCGATPVFVDIGADVTMDLAKAQQLVSKRTRALVYVHLFGAMGDPDAIETFAAANDLILIEDYAQSLGARYGGRPAGSLGLASATSFDPTKVLGAPGSGGMLVTDDDDMARRVRGLRLHGKQGSGFVDPGYNSQLPSLAAAVLNVKLDHHLEWTSRRARVAERYMRGLDGLPLNFVPFDARVEHVWHKFVLTTDRRDELRAFLEHEGVPTRVHYETPLHRERIFASRQDEAQFPMATAFSGRTLSLPIHSHLSDGAVDHVIECVRRFFG